LFEFENENALALLDCPPPGDIAGEEVTLVKVRSKR
jgi:hypothetical protein